MYKAIGISFMFGFAVILIMGIINYFIGKKNYSYQKNIMNAKDRRMKCTNETFSNIKYIKTNDFEEHFNKKIEQVRKNELN